MVADRNELGCGAQPSTRQCSMDANDFRRSVRGLVRALGVLDEARTPCGVDISVREAYALDAISTGEDCGAALSQSDLQAALGIDKSNVTRVVQQLVTDGRIEQRTSADDARVRRLHLTGKGRRVVRNIEEQSLRRFSEVLGRIPASERANVVRAIELFRVALIAEGGEGPS
jgi:DNA-binding MarR family transcriptional regulator